MKNKEELVAIVNALIDGKCIKHTSNSVDYEEHSYWKLVSDSFKTKLVKFKREDVFCLHTSVSPLTLNDLLENNWIVFNEDKIQ